MSHAPSEPGERVRVGYGVRLRYLLPLVGLAAFAGAAYLLYRNLQKYDLGEIGGAIRAISTGEIALGACFAAASYLTLTGFDALAARYARVALPYRTTAFVSFVSMSIGQNIGLSGFGSSALRYRLYSTWGVHVADIARIILFYGLTIILGLITLTGLACLFLPSLAGELTALPRPVTMAIGALCLLVTAVYLAIAAFRKRPIRLRRAAIEVPSFRLAAAQVALGTANFALVAGLLHQLLTTVTEASYVAVVAVYVVATAASLLSQVPGGLGVLEAVVVSLVPGADVFAAVIVYRVLYFLGPLVIGGSLFALSELWPPRPGTVGAVVRRRREERRRALSVRERGWVEQDKAS